MDFSQILNISFVCMYVKFIAISVVPDMPQFFVFCMVSPFYITENDNMTYFLYTMIRMR
jgi:hypothetical protein